MAAFTPEICRKAAEDMFGFKVEKKNGHYEVTLGNTMYRFAKDKDLAEVTDDVVSIWASLKEEGDIIIASALSDAIETIKEAFN